MKPTDSIPRLHQVLREFRMHQGWPVRCRQDEDFGPGRWKLRLCKGTKAKPCCLLKALSADGKHPPSVATVRNWESPVGYRRRQPTMQNLYRLHMLFRRHLWRQWRRKR